MFVADAVNHRVRKIDVFGNISTIAGNGVGGYSGDNGHATAASITGVTFLNSDQYGNLMLADQFDQRIRKIDAFGIIRTIAGKGSAGFSGDGGAATAAEISYPTGIAVNKAGDLYFSDFNNKRIRLVTGAVNEIINTNDSINLLICPNPSTGIFVISSPCFERDNVKIYITNILGKIIYEVHSNFNKIITCKIENPGYYMIHFSSAENIITSQIIIK